MTFPSAKSAFLSLLLALPLAPALAQQTPPLAAPADTLHKFERPLTGQGATGKHSFFQSKGFKALAVPAVLIGYGAYTFNGGGFYTNQQANTDIHRLFPVYRTSLDNILVVVPYLELAAVELAGVEARNDRLNTLLLIAKGEVLMFGTTLLLKDLTREERPDGSDRLSFPSAHTAQAFLAASIVHTELRDRSQWYGVGAYAVATSVAALRMINTKHWQSDVLAGAGIGILSAHVAYLTHRNRWGRKPGIGASSLRAAPMYYAGATGLTLQWRLR